MSFSLFLRMVGSKKAFHIEHGDNDDWIYPDHMLYEDEEEGGGGFMGLFGGGGKKDEMEEEIEMKENDMYDKD